MIVHLNGILVVLTIVLGNSWALCLAY